MRLQRLPGQPTGTITLSDGTVITKNRFNQPLVHVLAEALLRASPGDVLELEGVFEGVVIGRYDPSKANVAWWGDGVNTLPIQDVAIISKNPNQPATIRGVQFSGNLMPGQGGSDRLLFKDLMITAPSGNYSAIQTFQFSRQGYYYFYNVSLFAEDLTAYQGYGMMSAVRAHGPAKGFDFRDVSIGRSKEHSFYLDSLGWDNQSDSFFVNIQQTEPSGRTFFQLVNRASPSVGSGISGYGRVVIANAHAWTQYGTGGSGFSIVGHLGSVFILDSSYRGDMGAVVFWSDSGKGLFLNPNGYTTSYAEIRNFTVNSPAADRSHVMISGVEEAVIGGFSIMGNRTVFDLESQFGGPIPNGSVIFQTPVAPSGYSGFQAGTKVRNKNITLSNQQIDMMWDQP